MARPTTGIQDSNKRKSDDIDRGAQTLLELGRSARVDHLSLESFQPATGRTMGPYEAMIHARMYELPKPSAKEVRRLKYDLARKVIEPYFEEEGETDISKFTRGNLVDLIQSKVDDGTITPESFWKVVQLPVRRQKQASNTKAAARGKSMPKKNAKGKQVAAEAANENTESSSRPALSVAAPDRKSPSSEAPSVASGPSLSTLQAPMPPGLRFPFSGSISSGRGLALAGAGFPGTTQLPLPQGLMPPRPPPQPPMFKYALDTPKEVWNAFKMGYPAGILMGGPLPPAPAHLPSISGVFHSSALLPVGANGELVGANAVAQIQYVFSKLDRILSSMTATVDDILAVTIHVVDMHLYGRSIQKEKDDFFDCKNTASMAHESTKNYALSMIGVGGLMPVGALVQVEVKVIVRRAFLSRFKLQKI